MAMQGSAKVDQLLKLIVSEKAVKPSGLIDHKLDDRGLEMKIFIPRDKLTGATARDLVSLLMSEMM